MPPKGKLSAAEIARLTRWVALGAPWPEAGHDASVAPAEVRGARRHAPLVGVPAGPARAPAGRRRRAWPRSEIDRFILAELEAHGLTPAGPADRRTLLRRATFDLTGLPPTPEEVDAFLADDSPDAFARVVDRLLASPAYGERWARHWLDVVRYADYHDGNPKARDRQLRAARSLALSRLGGRRRSTATCPSTSSSSTRSPATCCPAPTARSSTPTG